MNKNYVTHAGLRNRHWDIVKRLLWEHEQHMRAMLFDDLPLKARQEFEAEVRESRTARLVICAQLKGRP